MAKKMTEAKYKKLCRDIASDFVVEYADELGNDMLYFDTASCIIDNDDPEGIVEYLESFGVKDVKGCIADDIYSAVMKAKRK